MKRLGTQDRRGVRLANTNSSFDERVTMLAVGDTETWTRLRHSQRAGPVRFVGMHELTPELIEEYAPSVVVSPLVSRRFDCLDVAVRLHSCGFPGQYRVIDNTLPDPSMIVREVRSITPGLDFDIYPEDSDDAG